MTITFTPPKPPGFSSKKTTSYRVRKAEFGDGYVQVGQDGLNAATVAYDLVWNGLTLADADTIEAFFNARGGWESFFYTVPHDVQRKYRNGNLVRAYDTSGVVVNVSVTITEDHSP